MEKSEQGRRLGHGVEDRHAGPMLLTPHTAHSLPARAAAALSFNPAPDPLRTSPTWRSQLRTYLLCVVFVRCSTLALAASIR